MASGKNTALATPQLNAFLVARGLLQRGQQSIDRTSPGMITAVILFDAAVETASKATLAAFPPGASDFPGTGYFKNPSKRRELQRQRQKEP
jgi:hypothetical protein